jgi:hypothetical protein
LSQGHLLAGVVQVSTAASLAGIVQVSTAATVSPVISFAGVVQVSTAASLAGVVQVSTWGISSITEEDSSTDAAFFGLLIGSSFFLGIIYITSDRSFVGRDYFIVPEMLASLRPQCVPELRWHAPLQSWDCQFGCALLLVRAQTAEGASAHATTDDPVL